jgi:hypothetical protein
VGVRGLKDRPERLLLEDRRIGDRTQTQLSGESSELLIDRDQTLDTRRVIHRTRKLLWKLVTCALRYTELKGVQCFVGGGAKSLVETSHLLLRRVV